MDQAFRELKAKVQDRKAILVVGTGISVASVAAEQRGLAGWPGLLRHGVEHAANLDPTFAADSDKVLARLGSPPTLDRLLTVASEVERVLTRANRFGSWIEQTAGALTVAEPSLIAALGRFNCPILTTNYDTLIEEVLGRQRVTWKQTTQALAALRGDKPHVVHLHGSHMEPDTVILGDGSYARVANDAPMQALYGAMSAMGTLVFVGCGAAGLTDPDLGLVFRRFAAHFPDSLHSHFLLVRDGEGTADLPQSVRPIYYGPDYDDLRPFLDWLAEPGDGPPPAKARLTPSASVVPPTLPVRRAPDLPPVPDHFIGRESEVKRVVAALAAGGHVLFQGAPGIGKTSLCTAALHEPEIAARYQDRRWFARLEAATEPLSFFAAIGEAIGLGPTERTRPSVLYHLNEWAGPRPALLVLDNLETPRDRDPEGIADALAHLKDIAGLTIAASLRGTAVPHSVAWQRVEPLDRLPDPYDRELFLTLTQKPKLAEAPELPLLLTALEGLPLAIRLMARQAAKYPLPLLWELWQEQRTALLKSGDSRETNLAVCIELSIASNAMDGKAKSLLRIMGLMPNGVARAELRHVAPHGREAAGTLVEIGLAAWSADQTRLVQLAPIREHVRLNHRPPEKLLEPVLKWAIDLARLGDKIGKKGGAEAVAKLTPEARNLESFLSMAMEGRDKLRERAIVAADDLAKFARQTGVFDAIPLMRSAAACTANPVRRANCLMSLGRLAEVRSRLSEAETALQQAITLFRQTSTRLGEAHCLYFLGSIFGLRSDFGNATAVLSQALDIYHAEPDRLGQANCIFKLGELGRMRALLPQAKEAYQNALLQYQHVDVDDDVGQGNCIFGLGAINRDSSRFDEAAKAFWRALPLFRQAGNRVGEANCLHSLGDVDHLRSRHEQAKSAWLQAVPIYRQVGNLLGQANCLHGLAYHALETADPPQAARLAGEALALLPESEYPATHAAIHVLHGDIAVAAADWPAAAEHFQAALDLFARTEDIDNAGEAHRGLGDVAFGQGDTTVAISQWSQALELFARIPAPHLMAPVHQRLARVTTEDDQAQHLATARAMWTEIDLPHRLRELDDEFGPPA
ncbi:tetratricopeptide repeat protein [Magnetospirillum moscoviense]|uniref:Novel STAND NTPase 1 domain-containing protein n=1 Tax=Magnetospirillum moscoviense TaxID=1437059 RepID=A0A178MLC0_9PROT|nr:tetratricopeptide repeat protein [Magnetospirillum moscoviense]OAN49343.1 hypothetical protein A6A05_14150 [Magnetospirillum moscoviense]